MNLNPGVSRYGARATHVLEIVGAILDSVSRFLWITSYRIAERRHWGVK